MGDERWALIVPTLRVGMQCVTLCVTQWTRSVRGGVTTRSVGTIKWALGMGLAHTPIPRERTCPRRHSQIRISPRPAIYYD
jgi:hypothetical protein